MENVKALLLLVAVVALLALGVACEFQSWYECRRIHPWWYCAGDGRR